MTPTLRTDDLKDGIKRLQLVQAARMHLEAQPGLSWAQLGALVGHPASSLFKLCQKVAHLAVPSAEDLAGNRRNAGRPRKYRELKPEEAHAVKSYVAKANRTKDAGSVPQGLRIAAKRGELGEDLVDQITARAEAGQPLLTDAQARTVRVPKATVHAMRSPREAWLNYVQNPGSTLLTIDQTTGEERMLQPGERFTIDDGTINLGCVVKLERVGDKCWEKFGVIVGRFQFLLVVDCRTHNVTGFSYTARPKSSYRAEDLTATMHNTFCEHGRPREMLLEHGISASNLVHDTLELAGIQIIEANSPHQKIVENVFNKLWTKLAELPGQVGRYRGEEEEMGRVMESCRRGEKNPEDHFAPLHVVVEKLREAIAEHNSQWIHSTQYGRWIPAEFFAKSAHKMLRPLPAKDYWMFSPVITQPLKLRGFCVGTSVNLMPGYSIKYHFDCGAFAAELLGAKIKLHFNPFAPDCVATAVLAEDFAGRAAKEFLGEARQFNRHACFTRRAFGYGMDKDIGREITRSHAQALSRSAIAVRKDGSRGLQTLTARKGNGDSITVERASRTGDGASRTGQESTGQEVNAAESIATTQRLAPAPEPVQLPYQLRRLMEEEISVS